MKPATQMLRSRGAPGERISVVFTGLALALGAALEARGDPLPAELPFEPDRPGVPDAVGLLPPLRVMAEVGVDLRSAGGELGMTGPLAVLRLGVSRLVEARLALPAPSWRGGGDRAWLGLGDLAFGAKLALPEVGPLGSALVAMISAPTGATGAGHGSWTGELGLNGAAALGPTTLLAGVARVRIGAEAAPYSSTTLAATLYQDLTPSLYVFAQVWLVHARGGAAMPAAGGGLGWEITRWWQVDVQLDAQRLPGGEVAWLGTAGTSLLF